MSSLCDRNYMVDRLGHRVREPERLVYRKTAYTADSLRSVDDLLVFIELRTMRSVLVRSRSFLAWHIPPKEKGPC